MRLDRPGLSLNPRGEVIWWPGDRRKSSPPKRKISLRARDCHAAEPLRDTNRQVHERGGRNREELVARGLQASPLPRTQVARVIAGVTTEGNTPQSLSVRSEVIGNGPTGGWLSLEHEGPEQGGFGPGTIGALSVGNFRATVADTIVCWCVPTAREIDARPPTCT